MACLGGEARDIGTKVPLYARHGIPEVWVIDVAMRRTRLFRQPAGSSYADESSVEPHGPRSCASVVDAAPVCVIVELARLLPPAVGEK